MGRQSTYSQIAADEIIYRLSQGEPLAQICRDENMPSDGTVRNWMLVDTNFADAIAHARIIGFDIIAAQCLHIADNPVEGEETTTKPNGDVETKRGDMLGHRKLQIDTRLKLLAKWDPKRFGDKITQELTGADGGPVQTVTRIELVAPKLNDNSPD